MSNFDKCPICKEFGWLDNHVCAPIYTVYEEDGDPTKIHAHDSETAAEKWAEIYDSDGSYTIGKGNDVMVTVENPNGKKRQYVISGEYFVKYDARE